MLSLASEAPAQLYSRYLPRYRIDPNITYVRNGQWEGKLDVYARIDPPVAEPTLVWLTAQKSGVIFSLLPYMELGWNVVSVEYQVYDVTLAPVALENTLCALRWIMRNGHDYNLDLSKVVVSGASAGGWFAVAAALGVRPEQRTDACPDPTYWHLMVEAKKLAYADLLAHNADPKFTSVPVDRLLSKSYAATLCDRIDPHAASTLTAPEGADGGTIYVATADRWGNMVSLIHSVFSVYGSRTTVAPYGFVLHNRGTAFSLDPASPNIVAPRKRPFHSIIAGFVTKDGQPLMAFGNMGGSVQPETHAQHMVNLIDHGMNVQMTTDAARFSHNQFNNVLRLEAGLFNLVGPALQAKGHELREVTGQAVGGYQGILFTRDPRLPAPSFDRRSISEDLPVNGVYRAGSDHRKDGQAVGW
jgi:gamma-glutamyltranspeptidase